MTPTTIKEGPAVHEERVEPLLLDQLIKTTEEVARLSEELKMAQGASQFIGRDIRERHRLAEGDSFDSTGLITRKSAG